MNNFKKVVISGNTYGFTDLDAIHSLSGYATEQWVEDYTYDKATIDDKIASGGGASSAVTVLSGDVISLSGDVIELSEKVDNVSGDVIVLSGDVKGLEAKVDTLSGNVYSKSETDDKIDQSISGKADSDEVYKKSETSGKTELSDALNLKADKDSVYTKAEVDASQNAQNVEIAKKLDASAYTPTDLSDYYKKTETSGNTELSTEFAKYYQKDETSSKTEIDDALDLKLDASAFTESDYYKKSETSGKTELDAEFALYYKKSETSGKTELSTALAAKQNTLTAGDNVSINGNVISATDTKYTAGDNITIDSNNVISASGGGSKAIVAGRGIKVTSGETADTVAFDMPITDSNPSSTWDGYLKMSKPLGIGSPVEVETDVKFVVSQNNGDVWRAYDFVVSGDGRIFINDYNSRGYRGVRDTYCLQDKLDSLQPTLSAGTGVDITDNVISVTGGGESSGITSGEVQTMIDESISGKADSSDVYLKTETYTKTEVDNKVWCGDETAWSQISGSTENGVIYLVY